MSLHQDGRTLYPEAKQLRPPRNRSECIEGPRPCPWVGCKYHLYLDVSKIGSIRYNFPDLEPWELANTCALDIAERGGCTLDEIGMLMNVVRERGRQIEKAALNKLRMMAKEIKYE